MALLFLQSGYQEMFLSLLHLWPKKKSQPFWAGVGWHCVLWNNGYYVLNKTYAAALALQRPVPFCSYCLLRLCWLISKFLRWLIDKVYQFFPIGLRCVVVDVCLDGNKHGEDSCCLINCCADFFVWNYIFLAVKYADFCTCLFFTQMHCLEVS